MQTKLLHAILSGVIIALVLGVSLIPTTWRVINQENGARESFSGIPDSGAIIVIVASIVVIVITLISFKLIGRVEE